MQIRSRTKLWLVACLAIVLTFGGLAQALAATVARDLPAGSKVAGVLASDGQHDWKVVVRKGQEVKLKLQTTAGYSGQAWVSAFDSLASINTVPPLSDLGIVNGTGSTEITFTVPYNTVMAVSVLAPAPSHGGYTLQYTLGDPPTTGEVPRVAGTSRFDTAILISQGAYKDGSADTAIVASGIGFADALAASGLAGSYDCPVLLTGPATLAPGVDAEITRLGATTVFVVGGTGVVSANVVNALKTGGRTVTRIAGTNRFTTAAAISQQIRAHETAEGRTPSTEAFVVSGLSYPDALSISSYAFAKKMPILLVSPSLVPAATSAEITAMSATMAYVIGGEGAISAPTMASLSVESTRVAGATRIATSIAAANFAVDKGWGTWGSLGVVTGFNYPDALAGGPSIGKDGGVMLLTMPTALSKDLYSTIYTNRASIAGVKVFGGTTAIFGSVIGGIDDAIQGRAWVDPYGFAYTAN